MTKEEKIQIALGLKQYCIKCKKVLDNIIFKENRIKSHFREDWCKICALKFELDMYSKKVKKEQEDYEWDN